MKLSMKKLTQIKPSLQKLLSQDIPVKTSFKLTKWIKTLNPEYESFEESRKKLFEKYGTKNIEGNLEIKPEKAVIFNKEFKELLKIEVDVKLDKIKLEDLGEKIEISPLDLSNLVEILIKE